MKFNLLKKFTSKREKENNYIKENNVVREYSNVIDDNNDSDKNSISKDISKDLFEETIEKEEKKEIIEEEIINQTSDELSINMEKNGTNKYGEVEIVDGLFELESKEKIDVEQQLESEPYNINKFLSSVGDLDNYSSLEILRIMYRLNNEERKIVFESEIIKDKLQKSLLSESPSDQYWYYRELMHYIRPSELLSLYSADYLKKFFSIRENGQEYKLFVSLCEKDINETVNYVLDDDKMFYEFFKENDYFYSVFTNLDYELLRQVVFKMEKSDVNFRFDFLCSCSIENQIKLLNEELKDDTILKAIGYFRVESISDFFQNNIRAKYLYRQVNIPNLLSHGVKFSSDIVKSKYFFDSLKNSSFVEFRNNINNAEKYNDAIFIEERLKDYYEELINNYNPETRMFKDYDEIIKKLDNIRSNEFNNFILSADILIELADLLWHRGEDTNIEDIKQMFINETSKKISEIIVDALFQDNIYNVILNVKEMLRYNESLSLEEKVLDETKVNFYKMILDIDKLDSEEKIKLYNHYKDSNLNMVFYEDLRSLKDLSYEKIKRNIINPIDYPEYLEKNITSEYGVEVYDLRNKEYTMLVRRQAQYREKSTYLRNCYSLISNENNKVFGGDDSGYGFLYGYTTFDNDKILHILESDSYSASVKEKSSRYVNRIMSSREIINSNNSYSEIQIVNKKNENFDNNYDVLTPSYLVVFDEVTRGVINEAKRLNIPIVIITKKELTKDNQVNVSFERNQDLYIDSRYEEIGKKNRR